MRDTGVHGPRLVGYFDEVRGKKTNTEFAASLGLTGQRITAWRKGDNPTLGQLRRVADGLGLTLSDVLIIAGYATAQDFDGSRAPEPPKAPSLVEALETDPALSEPERTALRIVVNAILETRDGTTSRRSAHI